MAKYKAYPEYKYSEIEWLGKIPSGWLLKKAKYIFQRVQRPLRDIDGVVTAFRDGQVTLRTNRRTDGFTNSVKEIGYQGVRRNDLVIHAMDGFAGAIGVSDSDGKCSPVCSVCIPWQNQPLNMRFYGYLVRQLAVTDFILSLAKGIRERSTEFRFSEFSGLMLPIPPIYEQDQIAKFLDHETAKIDNLIEKQQQLIELLKEKRQAVISHAVTKGLNPDVPMKDSGVEWLGEVPEHWKIKRCKNLFNFVTSGSRGWAGFYSDEGDLFFRIANLTRDSINPKLDSIQYVTPPKGSEGERSKIKENDLLISITADLGSVCAADESISEGYVSQHISLCRPGRLVASSRWLAYFVLSDTAKEQLQGAGYGGTKVQLSLEDIRDLFVAYPPKSEQIKIASYLDERLSDLDGLDHRAHNLIGLLRERRTAIISAAVTGKIDVRDWVAPDTQNAEEPQEATA
ncbi:restriction endonuclease subunit S [Klebsiella pneumoniae]|uniref:restriction endonuclease subunit S n=1 Tax=Klebsiella pneumoniae TaxID=573 RepID=UPI001E4CE7A6|nr:restriction endonuclease subunit S [Klebsiella pneumoniae]MDQ6484653.1 restriction endonuclease subunit S [Klebsiella pneumoniae]